MSEINIIDSYGDRVVIKRDDLKDLERQLDKAREVHETFARYVRRESSESFIKFKADLQLGYLKEKGDE